MVASVQRFRRERPDAAATVAQHLDAYVADLEILAGIAARYRTVDASADPWSRWEVFELRGRAPVDYGDNDPHPEEDNQFDD